MTVRSPAAGAAAPPPLRTSSFVIRPRGPVPVTAERSTPSAAATRAATGVTFVPCGTGAAFAGAAFAGAPLPEDGAGLASPAPTCIRAMTWPTVTVSPSSKRISVIVPLVGAGSSMSTLSVESSTTVSPSSTASPTLTDHSRIVPSVTKSPPVGVAESTISTPVSAGSPSSSSGGAGVAAAGPEPLDDSISHSSWPTSTVSPSPASTLTMVPAVGEGTSASTLSVEISTRTSSRSTESPSFLCHSRTVPSVTDSPIAGMVTCTVVFTAIESLTLARRRRPSRTSKLIRAHERADPTDHDYRDRDPQRDDLLARRVQARDRHRDPAEAVGQPEDELECVQARDEPHDQQRRVDHRVCERRALEPLEGEERDGTRLGPDIRCLGT